MKTVLVQNQPVDPPDPSSKDTRAAPRSRCFAAAARRVSC